MMNELVMSCYLDNCDVYFENMLISKEKILSKYAEFIMSTLIEEQNVGLALHTGSICFDLVSYIVSIFACLSLDKTDAKSIIDSLNKGDIVLFKNERHRWRGIDFKFGRHNIILEQDGHGKNGKTTLWLPYDTNKNLIKPYFGSSNLTDGRGIKQNCNERTGFISYILGVPETEIPSVTGVSVVIVTERSNFDRFSKGLRIEYGDSKSIGILDIVTASYYSENGEEYQYGNNAAKTEPVLKVTGKISTARNLILSKQGNKTVGLVVIGSDAVSKGYSDLIDLLERKTLKFAHVVVDIDSEFSELIVDAQEDAAIFACTREYLLEYSLPLREKNKLTLKLDRQVENILNNTIKTEIIVGGCSWEAYSKTKEALYMIRNSDWNDIERDSFVIKAYSLLNLLTTAVFPIIKLEKAIQNGKLAARVSSPALRIKELYNLTNNAKTLESQCIYVVDVLEQLYKASFSESTKYNFLRRYIEISKVKKIAVVVPKAYYIDLLCEDEIFNRKGITIVTVNRFDNTEIYDEIIVIGDFVGKRFNTMKCRAAQYIIVLLYECEVYRFKYKMEKAQIFENKLNSRLGVTPDYIIKDVNLVDGGDKSKISETFMNAEIDLEEYIENISTFNISKYVSDISSSAGNILTSEVCGIGKFVTGEQVLFSKYYNAVVFHDKHGTVSEIPIENLSVGNQLIFTKRDDYTKNMVDYIYENLQLNGRLSLEVADATRKAAYWKEVLRTYKDTYNLSYRDIAMRLQEFGSSLQEASIRQWLMEESHIIGPRDEATLQQIAKLTQDMNLLDDSYSFFEACRVVRRQRKEILELIGRSIVDKLSGKKPPTGSIIEVVYDNVENLSDILELESFKLLEEPVMVPINLVNKPILD